MALRVKCVSVYGQNPAFQLVSPPCFECLGPLVPVPQPEEFNTPPSPASLNEDGTIINGSGISAEFATSVTDTLLELFLIPMIANTQMIGPSEEGTYVLPLPSGKELSVAFGVTSLTGRRITQDYFVELTVAVDEYSTTLSLVDGATPSSYVWTDEAAYNITDSAGNAGLTTAQNATRLRFLVDGELLPPSADAAGVSVWVLTATNIHTATTISATITVDTSV
jgi:hypothetical protein